VWCFEGPDRGEGRLEEGLKSQDFTKTEAASVRLKRQNDHRLLFTIRELKNERLCGTVRLDVNNNYILCLYSVFITMQCFLLILLF